MNTQKLLIGTVVGAIFFFLIDWLLYGMLMADMWNWGDQMRESPDYVWMVIGYVLFAGAFTWIYNKGVGNASRIQEGIRYALALGVLVGFGMNLVWYSLTSGNELTTYLIDGVITIVKYGVGAIIIAYVIGVPGVDGDRGKDGGGGGGGGV